MTLRRACASCHVPLYGDRPGIPGEDISHGLCDVCGVEIYGPLWRARTGAARWPGVRLSVALRRAGHSERGLARDIGVSHTTIQRARRRERVTVYVMRRLMDSRRGVYYHSLTAPVGA
jgi:hypothetical protein